MLAATSVAVGAGAAATARPGADPEALTPTATLAANGGADAPQPGAPGGGAEAPMAVSPAPPKATGPAPVPIAPPQSPIAPPSAVDPGQPAPSSPAPAPDSGTPAPAKETDPAPAEEGAGEDELQPPRVEEALQTGDSPLIPLADLAAGSPTHAPALVDISPAPVPGPALVRDAELAEPRAAQQQEQEQEEQDDGEIVIPVEPDSGPTDDTEASPSPDAGPDAPATQRPAAEGRLALTGLSLTGPLGTGLLALLIGVGLRISIAPIAASRARA